MVERLTILKVEQDEDISLQTNQQDVWTTAIKVVSNMVPFGSPIGELITSFIPNQKIERVIKVTKKLNEKLIDYNSKLNDSEKRINILELKSIEFADLYEEGANQASRGLTDERLEYIASLLKNSLTDEELEHIEKKKLLLLLGELNDAEIIWLKNYSFRARNTGSQKYKNFYEKHENILGLVFPRVLGGEVFGDKAQNKESLRKSYTDNLLKLGLVKEDYNSLRKDKLPDFDQKTGKLKSRSLNISRLGIMLLKQIDLAEN